MEYILIAFDAKKGRYNRIYLSNLRGVDDDQYKIDLDDLERNDKKMRALERSRGGTRRKRERRMQSGRHLARVISPLINLTLCLGRKERYLVSNLAPVA